MNGKLAALSRFLPRLTEKAKPFFRLLKGAKNFTWDEACEDMFVNIKRDLSAPLILISPPPEAPLLVYLVVAQSTINSVLVYEEGRKQSHVYFISRTLQPAEERYQVIKKLVLALVFAARRLRHYFRNHGMTVKTNYPLKQVLQRPELAGRMTAWAVELSEFGLHYESMGPMKVQFLAEFLTELPPVTEKNTAWLLIVDGSSNKKGSGARVILEGPD